MNTVTNSLFGFLLKYLKLFIIIFILNSALFIYLPKKTVDYVQDNSNNQAFYHINLNKVFEEKQKKPKKVVRKKVTKKINSIVLSAIYAFENETGWIIVSTKSNPRNTKIITVGDRFLDYKLVRLYPKKAIFLQNSVEYEVSLDNKINTKPLSPRSVKPKEVDYSKPVGVSKKYVKKYMKDFDAIWKSIAIKEVVDASKKIKGFKILSIKKNSAFSELGLRRGDVIKKVNNITLKSYADAFNIYNQIDKYDNLQITVERKGKEMEINYEID
ncbi:MAG: PDZ domain-containing protein [Campylobacterota bacterium]